MKNLAPIVLFVYNRPWHTEKTLTALSENGLASNSVLYIYADGSKPNATDEQLEKINQVRNLIKSKLWCKEVHIVESDKNKGLANSIIDGVTKIVNQYGKIIVLEDDIYTSKGYLKYMNDALDIYENEIKVAGVSGSNFDINSKDNSFFLRQESSWGWATWKRAWDTIDFDIDSLIDAFDNQKLIQEFNANNTYPFYQMLLNQKAGKVDSWAIRFYASNFLNGLLFLYPHYAMAYNIGTDEGTHYSGGEKVKIEKIKLLQNINIKKINIFVKKRNEKAYQNFHRENKRKSKIKSLKRILKSIYNKFKL